MIQGTGIAFIALQDLRSSASDEDRRRIWTPGELDFCIRAGSRAEACLAARYAAKKAILDALGIQESEDPVEVLLTDIEIQRSPSGAPYPVLQGTAAARADRLRITRWHLSLTHAAGYGAAFAIAEGEEGERAQQSGSGT